MTRIVGRRGTPHRRWFLLTTLLAAAAAVTVFAVAGAQAVHDTGAFELDGNAVSTTGNAGTKPDDWDRVCHQVLNSDCSTTANTNGATGVAFGDDRTVTPECAGGDNCTVFTGGGSKDPSDLSSWNWKTDSGGLPAKDNLQQGFAARYSLPGTNATGNCPNGTNPFDPTVNCSVVYFGSTRVANNGDAQQGVWFLQNRVGLNPDGTFCALDTANNCTGPAAHKAGDVLIVSDFSTGGATALIAVYKWVDSGGDISTNIQSLGGTPAGGTAECGATTPATGDPFCGIVNPTAGTTSPWPFLDKSGNTNFDTGELYEAGINLSQFAGLASECFATIVDESRASAGNTSATSPFATLKDFIISSFQPCTSGIQTTPQKSTITLGQSISDSAVVTGTGAGTPTGTVSFSVCNPSQTTNDASGNPTCPAPNGTAVGSPVQLIADPSDPTKANATSASITPGSAAYPGGVGTWCFRGTYNPAAGSQYKTATDATTTECFTVLQIDTKISTAQPAFYPNDSATVGSSDGSNLPANASPSALVFSLYAGAADSATNLANCNAGGATGRVYQQSFAITGGSPTETHSTTNASVTLNSSNTAYWRVVYTTGSPAYTDRESKCVEAVTHNTTDDPGPGTKP